MLHHFSAMIICQDHPIDLSQENSKIVFIGSDLAMSVIGSTTTQNCQHHPPFTPANVKWVALI